MRTKLIAFFVIVVGQCGLQCKDLEELWLREDIVQGVVKGMKRTWSLGLFVVVATSHARHHCKEDSS